MNARDKVRKHLETAGCSKSVVIGGLRGLIERWEHIVDAVAKGYPLDTIEDYLNDMDIRQRLDETLLLGAAQERASFEPRLRAADTRFQELVAPAGGCLWGEDAAKQHAWSDSLHWWYFSRPRVSGPGLTEDLRLWARSHR